MQRTRNTLDLFRLVPTLLIATLATTAGLHAEENTTSPDGATAGDPGGGRSRGQRE